MIDSLIEKDIELFLYLNNLGYIQWDNFWLILTNKFSAIPLYFLLLYVAYKQFGLKKTVILLLSIAALIFVSDQTSNLFKNGFKRLRPCHTDEIENLFRLVGNRCGGLYSYFSAHAANSMAVAVFFSLVLKFKTNISVFLLFFWAILVGYSRIYIGVHFPLDIITGMFFGILYGFVFAKLFIFGSNRFKF
jgi:undecaprenyl-diphosphatase